MPEPIGVGEPETGDQHGAFPRLTEDQLASLRAAGTVREAEAGDVLFRAGDDRYDFFAIEEGSVAIVDGYGRENRVIAVHGQHRFTGELNLLTGTVVYLTAVTRERSTLSQRELDVLRELHSGRSIPDVARTLYMSTSTAKTYVARIYDKLGVANRTQAFLTAMDLGLLPRQAIGDRKAG